MTTPIAPTFTPESIRIALDAVDHLRGQYSSVSIEILPPNKKRLKPCRIGMFKCLCGASVPGGDRDDRCVTKYTKHLKGPPHVDSPAKDGASQPGDDDDGLGDDGLGDDELEEETDRDEQQQDTGGTPAPVHQGTKRKSDQEQSKSSKKPDAASPLDTDTCTDNLGTQIKNRMNALLTELLQGVWKQRADEKREHTQETDKLTAEITTLKLDAVASVARIAQLEAALTAAQAETRISKQQSSSVSGRLKALRKSYASVKTKAESLQVSLTEAETSCKNLQSTVTEQGSLTQETQRVSNLQTGMLQQRMDDAEAAQKTTNLQNVTQLQQISELQRQLGDCAAEVLRHQQVSITRQTAANNLQAQVASLSQKLKEKMEDCGKEVKRSQRIQQQADTDRSAREREFQHSFNATMGPWAAFAQVSFNKLGDLMDIPPLARFIIGLPRTVCTEGYANLLRKMLVTKKFDAEALRDYATNTAAQVPAYQRITAALTSPATQMETAFSGVLLGAVGLPQPQNQQEDDDEEEGSGEEDGDGVGEEGDGDGAGEGVGEDAEGDEEQSDDE